MPWPTQRNTALRTLGPEYILENGSPELIDMNHRKDKLYRAIISSEPGEQPETTNILDYRCPSTDKRYIKWAHHGATKVREALNLRFGLTEPNIIIIET
jgi:hypothetical protein